MHVKHFSLIYRWVRQDSRRWQHQLRFPGSSAADVSEQPESCHQVASFWAADNKRPLTGVLSSRSLFFTGHNARTLRSRSWQCRFLPEVSLLASAAFLGLQLHLSSSCLCILWQYHSCLCVPVSSHDVLRGTCQWIFVIVVVQLLSHFRLFPPRTAARQASFPPVSTGFVQTHVWHWVEWWI